MTETEKKAEYIRCQTGELWPEMGTCDANATESVNVPDPEHEDDPEYDRLYWICLPHFDFYYHTFITRSDEGCECKVCTGKVASRSVKADIPPIDIEGITTKMQAEGKSNIEIARACFAEMHRNDAPVPDYMRDQVREAIAQYINRAARDY